MRSYNTKALAITQLGTATLNSYIYVDDSGSLGGKMQNIYYPSSTKICGAVVVRASQKRKLEKIV